MKRLFLIPLIFLLFFSCANEDKKEVHIIYRIGFEYIRLSFDEFGHGKARVGRGNSIDEDHFVAESTTDNLEFYGPSTPPIIPEPKPPTEAQIKAQLKDKPFVLIPNIPCETIKKWISIAKFIVG